MTELSSLVTLVLVLAVIAGLPHGAFDVYIANRLGFWRTQGQLVNWLIGYTLAALAIVGLWLLAPAISLGLFLLISALHFGRDHYPQQSLYALCLGFIILGLPLLVEPLLVASIFSHILVPESQAQAVVTLFQGLAIIGSLVILAEVLLHFNKRKSTFLLLMLLLAAAVLFHPLVYFALFFALSHSPNHLREQWQRLNTPQKQQAPWVILALTVVPILAAVAVLFYSSLTWDSKLLSVIFIGIAALTVPHMFLLELEYRATCQES